MPYKPVKVDEHKVALDEKLAYALENAVTIIQKNYLETLTELEVVEPSEEDLDVDIAQCGKFYKLTQLVVNKQENFLDKLITIANIACSVDGTLATIIQSDGQTTQYYLGIVSKNYRVDNAKNNAIRRASSQAFSGAVEGNFAGSSLQVLEAKAIETMQKSLFDKANAISAVSGIVTLRNKDDKQVTAYVQGIENLTDALRGKQYAIMLLADPVSTSEMQSMKQGYEMIYSQLSTFVNNVLTINESDNITMSNSKTEGITKGITEGISRTQSQGTTQAINRNKNIGGNITPFGLGVTFSLSEGFSNGTTTSESYGTNHAMTEQTMQQMAKSIATSLGTGKSLQISSENRIVKGLLEKIDLYIKRLEQCESFGAFNCAAYVLTESYEDALTVSSNYNALMRGEESFIQASQINCWNKSTWSKDKKAATLLKYLYSFTHPRFYMNAEKNIMVTPASIVSGRELAIQFGLPKKSIAGLDVIERVPFGRNIMITNDENIEIGNLYHMGKEENSRVPLNLQSIASHMFITGSTGSGKSNTIYKVLSELQENDVKFMVIEPAKGEYKHVLGNASNVSVFGTNNKINELLKINPFKFPEEIHVLEHIDRLIEIFNVCWPMYAAMPAVLKEAVEKAYEICGWNLATSENETGKLFYPTFSDVCETLNQVIESSAYADELKSNYKGSLLTRVKSLTNGLNGQMFCGKEIDSKELFEENVIIDLSRIGSMETKAMIMGILVMRLSEYRMAKGGINSPLKHVTILEEAHHLLKRTSVEQSSEGSNLIGKSVEMLTNAIAEMRTYGEGFIIADQSPGLLDLAVIRNTNTKIILRMPEYSDRVLVGKSAGMTEEQVDELSKLESGVAAVYQNNWLEPVLCKVDHYKLKDELFSYEPKGECVSVKKYRSELIKLLLKGRVQEEVVVDIELLEREVEYIDLSTQSKMQLYSIIEEYKKNNRLYIWQDEKFSILSKVITDLLECRERIDYVVNHLTHIEQLNETIMPLLHYKVEDISSQMMDEVVHCIIKEISHKSDEHLKLYYLWHQEMRKQLV